MKGSLENRVLNHSTVSAHFLNSDPVVSFLGGSWYRFVVTGDVTGGKLKTPADADSESLQAKWIADLGELSLRANDVIPLVERGRQFAMRRTEEVWHMPQVRIWSGLGIKSGPLVGIIFGGSGSTKTIFFCRTC